MCDLNYFESIVRELLPDDYDYKAIKCEVLNNEETNPKFVTEFRVNVLTEQELKTFLSKLNISSGCTFNVKQGRADKKCNTSRTSYRGFRKCCLNVFHKEEKENRQPGKNLECKADLLFRIETSAA